MVGYERWLRTWGWLVIFSKHVVHLVRLKYNQYTPQLYIHIRVTIAMKWKSNGSIKSD